MSHLTLRKLTVLPCLLAAALPTLAGEPPHLRTSGSATQLIVDGKPYLMLAGELHNSSASGVNYLRRLWPRLEALGLNTVLAPVSWELIEPVEGEFDLTLVDAMLGLAREHDHRLVLLWFGSWKNGVSSYAPDWVLKDPRRFPRARGSSRQNTKDVLSTVSANNLEADARAFSRLMSHLRDVDGEEHTVILVQVQNEVGIKPETRDLSDEATAAYNSAVPQELLDHLIAHREKLHREVLNRWGKSEFATSGTWPEVFGGGPEAEEIFSAWCYARYIDQVAAAGQKQYDLPMYVNAWLASELGTYPSGGPVAHMHDIWRAAAPHIAFLAPDIYVPEFKQVCFAYSRAGTPLFVPEARTDDEAAARAYWVIARHDGIGFAPFGIESIRESHPLVESYRILEQLTALITATQGTDRLIGVYQERDEESPGATRLGDYEVRIEYEKRLPESHPPVGGLVAQIGEDEFIVAGYGFGCRFQARTPGPPQTHIESVALGHFEPDGRWILDLRLNGDETGANIVARIPPNPRNAFLGADRPMILRVKVYRHD